MRLADSCMSTSSAKDCTCQLAHLAVEAERWRLPRLDWYDFLLVFNSDLRPRWNCCWVISWQSQENCNPNNNNNKNFARQFCYNVAETSSGGSGTSLAIALCCKCKYVRIGCTVSCKFPTNRVKTPNSGNTYWLLIFKWSIYHGLFNRWNRCTCKAESPQQCKAGDRKYYAETELTANQTKLHHQPELELRQLAHEGSKLFSGLCWQRQSVFYRWHTKITQIQPRKNLHNYTHTSLTALFPGLPGWAGTRKAKPIWILLKQETVRGCGISWAICKSAPRSRQITMPVPHHSVFYRPDALPAAQPTASKHYTITTTQIISRQRECLYPGMKACTDERRTQKHELQYPVFCDFRIQGLSRIFSKTSQGPVWDNCAHSERHFSTPLVYMQRSLHNSRL